MTRTVGMSAFVEHACVSVVCTGCGDDYDGDRARHFESIPQALRYVLPTGGSSARTRSSASTAERA